ncbi:MAG: hypothetical protein ABI667_04970 [Sphingomicrobium sp.]
MKHDAIKAHHLGMVTRGVLGCLPNLDDSAGQPLSAMKIVAQR